MVKYITIIFFMLVVSVKAETSMSIEELNAQCLIDTGQLRTALGQAQIQIFHLKRQIEELKKKESQLNERR